MNENPQEIVKNLIDKHGSRKAAFDAAVEGAAEAHTKKDLYGLSVWRDVKRILGEKIEGDAV